MGMKHNFYFISFRLWKEKIVNLKQSYSSLGKLFLGKDKYKQASHSLWEIFAFVCLSYCEGKLLSLTSKPQAWYL